MKWVATDLQRYTQAKEYVDTIVMPMIPFEITKDDEAIKKANQNEILSIISNEIESELSGRVMLLPNYYYLNKGDTEKEVDRLNLLTENLRKQPFEHFFFITFDMNFKKFEQSINGNLLWIPGVQSSDIHSKEVTMIIRDHVSQICELIRSYW